MIRPSSRHVRLSLNFIVFRAGHVDLHPARVLVVLPRRDRAIREPDAVLARQLPAVGTHAGVTQRAAPIVAEMSGGEHHALTAAHVFGGHPASQ